MYKITPDINPSGQKDSDPCHHKNVTKGEEMFIPQSPNNVCLAKIYLYFASRNTITAEEKYILIKNVLA